MMGGEKTLMNDVNAKDGLLMIFEWEQITRQTQFARP